METIAWKSLIYRKPLLGPLTSVLEQLGLGRKCGRRPGRKIVLELLPGERQNLLEDFAEVDAQRGLEFLNRSDLRRHLFSGRAKEVSLIVISRDAVCNFDTDAVLLRAHLAGIPIIDHHSISADLTGRIRLNDPDQWIYILAAARQTFLRRDFARFKRLVEPLCALALALLLSPLIAAICLAIKLTVPGPVLCRQTCTGYLGKRFGLLKFRSTYLDAADAKRDVPLGRLLRSTHFDAIPQLWHVFRGEMAFFGPRPEQSETYKRLEKKIPLFMMRTIVRPGITGWAQVSAGCGASAGDSLQKLEFDLYYIKYMSPHLDLIVLLRTIRLAVFGRAAERSPARQAGLSVLPVDNHGAVRESSA